MEGGLQAEAEARGWGWGEQTEELPTVYSDEVKYWGCGVTRLTGVLKRG